MAGRLEGKVAVVTGGAGGIGAATGRLFCEEGARGVVLVDRDAAAMAEACDAIRAAVPGAVAARPRHGHRRGAVRGARSWPRPCAPSGASTCW